MKLLFVVHQFLPRHVTGTEQYVRSVARGLIDRGHEVEIFAMEPFVNLETDGGTYLERDEDVDGIPVRRAGVLLDLFDNREVADYRNPLAVRLLRRFVDEREFDLAHVFHLRFLGESALIELRRAGVPVVVNLMDFWFVCPSYLLLRPGGELCDGPPENGLGCLPCLAGDLATDVESLALRERLHAVGVAATVPPDTRAGVVRQTSAVVGRRERLLGALREADAVLAPSRFLARMFEQNGFPAERIQHLPYGVDPDRLGGRRKDWQSEASGPVSGVVQIGYVGSITEHKGLHVLIEAVQKLPADGWRLHVHGNLKMPVEYGDRVVAQADGDPRIEFHGPFAPASLGEVLASIDVVVVPSLWYENTPFAILEAQMMGLPVVASRLGGLAEAVDHGSDGFLFKAGSVRALSGALRKFVSDPELLVTMSAATEFRTLDANLDDFEALYADVVEA